MSLHDIASWSEYYLTDDISAKDWKRFVLDFRSKFVYFLTLKIAHVKEDIRYFKYKQINACLWKEILIKHYILGEYCDGLFFRLSRNILQWRASLSYHHHNLPINHEYCTRDKNIFINQNVNTFFLKNIFCAQTCGSGLDNSTGGNCVSLLPFWRK